MTSTQKQLEEQLDKLFEARPSSAGNYCGVKLPGHDWTIWLPFDDYIDFRGRFLALLATECQELLNAVLAAGPEDYTQPQLHDYDAGFNAANSMWRTLLQKHKDKEN